MTPIKLFTPAVFEAGKFWMISVFLGSGQIPFFDTICPRTLSSGSENLHLSKFNFRFASCILLNTLYRSTRCCFIFGLKMVISSIYTTAHLGCNFPSIWSINRWNTAPDVFMPIGNTFHWYRPCGDVNAVISLDASANFIWWYPLVKSKVVNTTAPLIASN